MEVVGEAANGQETMQKVAEVRPDVWSMDIAMPGMDGMEATKHIKSQYPDVQVLALTMLEDERDFFQIVQAAPRGSLSRGAARRTAVGRADGRRRQRLSLPTVAKTWSASISPRPASMALRWPPMD